MTSAGLHQEKMSHRVFRGCFDRLDGIVAEGWALDEQSPDATVPIEILVDGVPVATGDANLFREDLRAAGIGRGAHGFRVRLPDAAFDNGRHELAIRSKSEGAAIGEPVSLQLDAGALLAASAFSHAVLQGALDVSERGKVAGWAWSQDDATHRVDIEIVDSTGAIVAEGRASAYRFDLVQAGIGDGFHAFTIDIPMTRGRFRHIAVNARVKGETVNLPGGPILVRYDRAGGPHTPLPAELALCIQPPPWAEIVSEGDPVEPRQTGAEAHLVANAMKRSDLAQDQLTKMAELATDLGWGDLAIRFSGQSLSLQPMAYDRVQDYANRLAVNGRTEEAGAFLAEHLKDMQQAPRLAFASLPALWQIGAYDIALRSVEEAAKDRPESLPINYMLGLARLASNEARAAVAVFDRLNRAGFRSADFHFNRSLAYLALGELFDCCRALEQARAIEPEHAASIELQAALRTERLILEVSLAPVPGDEFDGLCEVIAGAVRADIRWLSNFSSLMRRARLFDQLLHILDYISCAQPIDVIPVWREIAETLLDRDRESDHRKHALARDGLVDLTVSGGKAGGQCDTTAAHALREADALLDGLLIVKGLSEKDIYQASVAALKMGAPEKVPHLIARACADKAMISSRLREILAIAQYSMGNASGAQIMLDNIGDRRRRVAAKIVDAEIAADSNKVVQGESSHSSPSPKIAIAFAGSVRIASASRPLPSVRMSRLSNVTMINRQGLMLAGDDRVIRQTLPAHCLGSMDDGGSVCVIDDQKAVVRAEARTGLVAHPVVYAIDRNDRNCDQSWFVEVLPQILLAVATPELASRLIVVSNDLSREQRVILEAAGVSENRIVAIGSYVPIMFSDLIFPVTMDGRALLPEAVALVRHYLVPKSTLARSGGGRRIFIRHYGARHKHLNADETAAQLEAAGFVSVFASELSFIELRALLSETEVLVVSKDFALNSLLLLPAEAKALILSPEFDVDDAVAHIAAQLRLRCVQVAGREVPDLRMDGSASSFLIERDDLAAGLLFQGIGS